jgi:hypothetical protein
MSESFMFTASVSWAHFWSLEALKQVLRNRYDFQCSDTLIRTCPFEIEVDEVIEERRGVNLRGVCNNNPFKTRCGMTRNLSGMWVIDCIEVSINNGEAIPVYTWEFGGLADHSVTP